MSVHRTAEIIGAHMALSSPAAIAWRRVIDGEIPPEDAAALMESTEQQQLAKRVFAAPTQAHREALLAALLARLAAEDAATGGREIGGEPPAIAGELDATAPPLSPAPDAARSRRMLESMGQIVRPRRWRRRGVVLAMVAAAAILVPFLPQPHGALSTTYTLDPFTGDAAWRGAFETPPLPSYSRSSNLHLVLRPVDPVAGPVALVAFARSTEGWSVRLELQPRIAPNGLVSVDVPIRDTGLYEGEWELVLVVGRPGVLPATWQELERAEQADRAGESPAYEVLHAAIRVVSDERRDTTDGAPTTRRVR